MEQESTSRKVNETCIVTIVEKDGKLVKQDVEIPESEKIIDTLRGIVESKHCDLMALQRRFCYFTRWYDESYRYCLPFSYKETYIEMARKPKELTDKDLLLKRSDLYGWTSLMSQLIIINRALYVNKQQEGKICAIT